MQKQEPYMGKDNQQAPSRMRGAKASLTFWKIAWAVCIGILLANLIEAITATVVFYINVHIYMDPAVKKLLGL